MTSHTSPTHAVSKESNNDRIKIKNRRKRYLDRHPSYFHSPHHELAGLRSLSHLPSQAHLFPTTPANTPFPQDIQTLTLTPPLPPPGKSGSPPNEKDPLIHDRLIRQFQTASERATEAAQKGYAGVLEADLTRSEAKLSALRHKTPEPSTHRPDHPPAPGAQAAPAADLDESDEEDVPRTKDAGIARWRALLTRRFLAGQDPEFSYRDLDLGVLDLGREDEEDGAEEGWFEREEERWVVDSGEEGELELRGETGVQDF